jgi:hypothetical protein
MKICNKEGTFYVFAEFVFDQIISFLFHLKISVHLCNKFFFSTPKKVLKEKETRDFEQLQ